MNTKSVKSGGRKRPQKNAQKKTFQNWVNLIKKTVRVREEIERKTERRNARRRKREEKNKRNGGREGERER